MDYYKKALEMHQEHKGKIEVVSKVPVKTREDLSTAYTPGVAEPCREIAKNPAAAYTYTAKSNLVAVVSNGTAVLGLGNIGAAASQPVMEGKAILFKEFGGVDAFPICLDTQDPDKVIEAVRLLAPVFGGINLEDISSPNCFYIEETLEKELDIPVFHDDQHGTAIVVTAALLGALRVVKKDIGSIKVVVNGPGAAGTAIIKMLLAAGVKNVIACDENGILYKDRGVGIQDHKKMLCEITNKEDLRGDLSDAIKGADVFIGVSVAGALKPEMAKTMAKDAIVFAMANPTPEILPDEAKAAGVRVIGTGRSDFANQINNVLAFPGVFKGALSVRARDINTAMKVAAAHAIADLVSDEERSEDYIIPGAFDPRVAQAVADAVAKAARETGVARL
ncbi:NAD(P)-dependent malic enzyme [Allofournierella massiliensis]|uniref:Malate dehydrogenase (Oxaloacetate-decarboxylating) n=1 Tax=Allofournierella massiliensis TaxID=1650663 RepID=A0A4R1QJR7_9FIRM|nr:malic enzyme-like NAD(P)-binding protein [Fournierella massiliensis]TCL52911.1 malate dehydrogenase (oxaloacetate-decarboxylating) [Fournierella massiliensis]